MKIPRRSNQLGINWRQIDLTDNLGGYLIIDCDLTGKMRINPKLTD